MKPIHMFMLHWGLLYPLFHHIYFDKRESLQCIFQMFLAQFVFVASIVWVKLVSTFCQNTFDPLIQRLWTHCAMNDDHWFQHQILASSFWTSSKIDIFEYFYFIQFLPKLKPKFENHQMPFPPRPALIWPVFSLFDAWIYLNIKFLVKWGFTHLDQSQYPLCLNKTLFPQGHSLAHWGHPSLRGNTGEADGETG